MALHLGPSSRIQGLGVRGIANHVLRNAGAGVFRVPRRGDGVGGFCFEDEAAEGNVLSSDVRAVTAPWSAVSCMTDTGIVDVSSSRPSCCEAEARAVRAFAANALSLHLAGEGGGFFHRLTRH